MKNNANTNPTTDSIQRTTSKPNSRIHSKTRLVIRVMIIPVSLILLFVYTSLTAKTPIKKISAHVYQIELGAVNCFVIENESGLTLVDTGYEGDDDKIIEALKSISKSPSDIKQIVLTHLHADHAGAASSLSKQFNIPVYASIADGELLHEGHSLRDKHCVSKGLMNKILYKIFIKNIPHVKPIENIQFVSDGQILPATDSIKVIYTKGHTAGHLAIVDERDHVLLAGDACANNMGLAPSIIYEDIDGGNKTIKSVMSAIDFDVICFGHGTPLVKNARKKFDKFSSAIGE